MSPQTTRLVCWQFLGIYPRKIRTTEAVARVNFGGLMVVAEMVCFAHRQWSISNAAELLKGKLAGIFVKRSPSISQNRPQQQLLATHSKGVIPEISKQLQPEGSLDVSFSTRVFTTIRQVEERISRDVFMQVHSWLPLGRGTPRLDKLFEAVGARRLCLYTHCPIWIPFRVGRPTPPNSSSKSSSHFYLQILRPLPETRLCSWLANTN